MKKQIIGRKSEFKSGHKRFALVVALAAVAALASGCGQQAYNEGTVSTDPGAPTNGGIPTYPPGTSSGGTTSNPVATTTNSNGSPNYSFHFQETGSGAGTRVGGGSMTVTADSLLQVSITAGNGGYPVTGATGFTSGFNCEMFNITIGNLSETAFVRKSNYTDFMLEYGFMSYDPCQSAQTTWTYDFSPTLSVGRSQSLTIKVNGMQTDNCRVNSDPDDGGCGMTPLYSTHTVDAYIAVTTD